MTDKQTPEEKARAAAYADGVLAERGHTRRALDERDAERKAHDVEQRELLRQGMEHIARAEKAERERDEARALHDDALAGQIRIVANAVRDLASADASRETQWQRDFDPYYTIGLDIGRLQGIERLWSQACGIARTHCPVDTGLSHIRDGIPMLAKRAERAEASIAALVAVARRVEAAFCAAAAPAALPISTLVHPVAALTAALSDLTSAATAHDEQVRQEARAAAVEECAALLDALAHAASMEHDAQLADGEDEEARRYEVEMGALLEGRDCIRALASRPADYIEDRIEALVRERDEARAALVALREAASTLAESRVDYRRETVRRILAATPADLAARYRAKLCERVVAAEIERDELRAALAGLREVARVALLYGSDAGLTTREGQPIAEGSGPFATLRAALAATPADLAARYRTEVRRAALREAADLVDEDDRHDPHRSDWMEGRIQQSHAVALQLRALADEGEKMP